MTRVKRVRERQRQAPVLMPGDIRAALADGWMTRGTTTRLASGDWCRRPPRATSCCGTKSPRWYQDSALVGTPSRGRSSVAPTWMGSSGRRLSWAYGRPPKRRRWPYRSCDAGASATHQRDLPLASTGPRTSPLGPVVERHHHRPVIGPSCGSGRGPWGHGTSLREYAQLPRAASRASRQRWTARMRRRRSAAAAREGGRQRTMEAGFGTAQPGFEIGLGLRCHHQSLRPPHQIPPATRWDHTDHGHIVRSGQVLDGGPGARSRMLRDVSMGPTGTGPRR